MPPRYLPAEPFPTYAYVPGRQPHPVSDPRGHSYGRPAAAVSPPDPGDPYACPAYLRGIDLFNHGFYWEAHEVWEALWHACGRRGVTADYLKGLIKLAAAGVKAREGNAAGVASHARRARELLEWTELRSGSPSYMGLDLRTLAARAASIAAAPPVHAESLNSAQPALGLALLPGQSA